jgi:hypothetical protein
METDPPLNAPTGFLTGTTTGATSSLRGDVVKLRTVEVRRIEVCNVDVRIREAMVRTKLNSS